MPSPKKASSEPAKASPRSDVSVEVRLIPEFGGSPSESIAEWLEKVELVCDLRGIDKPETLVPLRLTGGAFAVYQQLSQSDKRDFSKLKEALLLAFGADSFAAYEQFSTRRLRPGETVDVFIAGLRKLALLFGGLPDKALICAFVAGLPDAARQALRASSRMEALAIDEVVTRARAIMADDSATTAAVRGANSHATNWRNAGTKPPYVCYNCNEPNHLARDCLLQRTQPSGGRSSRMDRKERKCHRCGLPGHIASACSGNDAGRSRVRHPPPPTTCELGASRFSVADRRNRTPLPP